jgi:hypothetical protein
MKREVAEGVIGAMKKMDEAIGHLDIAVNAIEDDDERKRMLRFIGGLVHDLHVEITLPVVRKYPDLHPDKPL